MIAATLDLAREAALRAEYDYLAHRYPDLYASLGGWVLTRNGQRLAEAGSRPMSGRARDFGIVIGRGRHGPLNAITDVAGVRVGHTTLISGDGPLRVGSGPVRTGVTVVVPHDGNVWEEPLFAGFHRLNGNGELSGLHWIAEAGLLKTVIGLTNTTASASFATRSSPPRSRGRTPGRLFWSMPVVGETWDGVLSDVNGLHVKAEHVAQALIAASDGPVAEGNVGGGTGMICHGFKGGIGTASRIVDEEVGGYVVGVLVQANHGDRCRLEVAGVPVERSSTRRQSRFRRRPRRFRLRPRAPAAPSSSSLPPTPLCCLVSARGLRNAPGSGWRGSAASVRTGAATSSSRSRRPTAACPPLTTSNRVL